MESGDGINSEIEQWNRTVERTVESGVGIERWNRTLESAMQSTVKSMVESNCGSKRRIKLWNRLWN